MFIKRWVSSYSFVYFLVRWDAGAVSFPLGDVIYAQVDCPLGACIIKPATAVIYGFRNKLEFLSLASVSSLV